MERTVRIRNEAAGAHRGSLGGCTSKAYNMLEIDGNELEINMYGEVVETVPTDWWTGKPIDGLYICEKEFLEDLNQYKEKDRITVRINSVGGDLYAGLAIANRMKELKAEIITIADALCASAAVTIHQAGNTRKVFRGSQIMIHDPSCYLYGRYDAHGINRVVRQLEAAKKAIIKTYEERTGRTEEELSRMLSEDSWMTGNEAVEEGFADEVIDGEVAAEITEDKKTVVANGIRFPAGAFFSLPKNLSVINGTGIRRNQETKNGQQEGEEIVTKKELMEKHPEMYNEICEEIREKANQEKEGAVSAAVIEERRRIREIEEISSQIGDEAMVKEAKYGEKTVNAAELAYEALKKQSRIGAAILCAMEEDVSNSGAEGVKPTPNAGIVSKEEQEMKDIMDGAALIAGTKGGESK